MVCNLHDSPGIGRVGFWLRWRVDGYHTRVEPWVSWLHERCCDTRMFSVCRMPMTFSLNFGEPDCKMNAGDMREILSSDVATVLRRLGGMLCSACCLSLIILAHIPCQCRCTLLSAPLFMMT